MDYKRNSMYFVKVNKRLLAFSISIIVLGLLFWRPTILFLLPFAFIVIFLLVFIKIRNKGLTKPTDAEIDAQVNADFNALFEKALEKHALTSDQVQKIPHIVLGGYMVEEALANEAAAKAVKAKSKNMFKDIVRIHASSASNFEKKQLEANWQEQIMKDASGITDVVYKLGKDKVPRASAVQWTVFLFSDSQVFIYIRQFSLVSPETQETVGEYFYQDIVSIATATDTASQGHVLQMSISDGTKEVIRYSMSNDDAVQRSITAFKQLVREIKSKR